MVRRTAEGVSNAFDASSSQALGNGDRAVVGPGGRALTPCLVREDQDLPERFCPANPLAGSGPEPLARQAEMITRQCRVDIADPLGATPASGSASHHVRLFLEAGTLP